jgi:hypothetical protein
VRQLRTVPTIYTWFRNLLGRESSAFVIGQGVPNFKANFVNSTKILMALPNKGFKITIPYLPRDPVKAVPRKKGKARGWPCTLLASGGQTNRLTAHVICSPTNCEVPSSLITSVESLSDKTVRVSISRDSERSLELSTSNPEEVMAASNCFIRVSSEDIGSALGDISGARIRRRGIWAYFFNG